MNSYYQDILSNKKLALVTVCNFCFKLCLRRWQQLIVQWIDLGKKHIAVGLHYN